MQKKDTRQAQPQSNGGSIGQGQQQQGQQQQLEPIETIIQLVMTQQMIEAQKVTRALRIHRLLQQDGPFHFALSFGLS